ncbi:MAG: ABC transporter substrate-binding protein [Sphaerochaetaceae bacterium]|jgi:putative ABC transport system substrate-binding protein|nr:ABC transporter substrate-binding protein [Sphaerochaetaceae bacterium]NLV83410.1 ABC transporter substrate-binding protein [Spirochaetales bacterium]
MKITRLLLVFALITGLAITSLGAQGVTDSAIPLVGISKIITHPALDAVEQGIQDYLASQNVTVRFDFQNANGDISTANSIAQKFKLDRVQLSVGIGTPVAQALVNTFSDVPVVFTAITDPVDAGLVPSYTIPHGGNVAGVSDMNPVESQIELLIRLTGAKSIGNVYASGEANGVILMEQAAAACKKFGVEFVTAAVSNTAEVKQATQSIVKRIDAMYIATDNTVISALASVADVCATNGVALMSADPSSVEGIDFLVAWGFNYYKIGLETGRVVKEILFDKKAPGDIGTVFLTDPLDFELWFNLDSAKKLGVTIPTDLLETAAVTIEGGKKIVK